MPTDPTAQSSRPLAFVSYATPDREYAKIVARTLEQAGFEPWLDFERIATSADAWSPEIVATITRAIKDADAFVLVWTDAAQRSVWAGGEHQASEVGWALQEAVERAGKRYIYVVRRSSERLPKQLDEGLVPKVVIDGRDPTVDLSAALRSELSRHDDPPAYRTVLAHDVDRALFDERALLDKRAFELEVDKIWGRICHHLLLYETVLLTDSAVAAHPVIAALHRSGRLVDLLNAGALKVALRQSPQGIGSIETLFGAQQGLREDRDVVADLERSIHAAKAFVTYPEAQIAARYTRDVASFFDDHESTSYARFGGDRTRVAQLERLRDYARRRDREKGGSAALRRNYFVWMPDYHSDEQLQAAGLPRELDPLVRETLEAGLSTAYRLNLPRILDSSVWLSGVGMREAERGNGIATTADSSIAALTRDDAEVDIELVPSELEWLVKPTDADYVTFGRVLDSAMSIVGMRSASRAQLGTPAHLYDWETLRQRSDKVLGQMVRHAAPRYPSVVFRSGEDAFVVARGDAAAVERRDANAVADLLSQRASHSSQVERPDEARERLRRDVSGDGGRAHLAALIDARMQAIAQRSGDGRLDMSDNAAPRIQGEHD